MRDFKKTSIFLSLSGLLAVCGLLPGVEYARHSIFEAAAVEAATGSAVGFIINVPGDYATIQAAFNAAADGDTILVAPGTYRDAINLAAKSVVLASWFLTTQDTSYIAQTILDGQGRGAVITMERTVGRSTMIVGFTIQNAGDGIATRAKFDVLHCRIVNCSDGIDYGAGSGGLCKFNLFENNSDDGVDLDNEIDIIVEDNIMRNNDDDGIEIRLQPYNGPLLNYVIRNNAIYGNREDGIQLIDYDGLSDRVLFIERNLIHGNRMAGVGCMSKGNTKENFEGASIPERIFLFNNTFSANAYGLTGGDSLVALNNIFVDHTVLAMKNVDGGSIVASFIYWNNATNLENCNVDSSSSLSVDPILDAQLHLQAASPAIDAGRAFFTWQGETVLDRPSGSYKGVAPDLGAFEFGNDATAALAIDDVTVAEGGICTVNVTFTVTLSSASADTVSGDYATADGSATAGSDYVAVSGQVSFLPGQTSRPVTVVVIGDVIDEPNETFFVNLNNATNAIIGDNQGAGTITNDDGAPSLSINDVAVTEGNSGTVNAVFAVTLSTTASQPVTVAYTTADGSATAGSDYVTASGQVSFQPGQTSQTVTVLVNADVLDEPNETFFVNLSNAANATIGDDQGAGTIVNDDGVQQPVMVFLQDGVNGYNGTRDTKLFSGTPGTNYGSATTLELDGSTGISALLSWNVASIPPGSTIQSVDITVNVTKTSTQTYEIYEMKQPWVEGEATWNAYASGLSWQVAGADGSGDRGTTELGAVTSASMGLQTISLNSSGIAVVQSWVDNPAANYGFIILDYVNAADGLNFSSREDGAVSTRPKLTVTYSRAGQPGGISQLLRGPYLQIGTPTMMTVRWRTDVGTDSRVRYGRTPNALSLLSDEYVVTAEHEVTLSGLLPNTKYYYSVGGTGDTLAIGPDYFFVTAPSSDSPQKSRIWVLGDAGTASSEQQAVRDAYYAFTDTTHTDLWLMLGDNAYEDGTDHDYQVGVFEVYSAMLRKSALWPTFGNHEEHSASSPTQTGPYYDIFTLPAQGEAGGIASGTEAYYSFDHANIHFICLNSHDIPRGLDGEMLTWLQNDLAANTKNWTIAFWHHPPYTKGSHDSDNESRLIEMRSNVLPILEDGGVDLVLTGHSHSYERSLLLDGHYGDSSTLTQSMILDSGDGRTDGDSAYHKHTRGPASHQGAVYIVAGSSGKTSNGSLDHPAMHISLMALGSVVVDVDSNRIDVTFLDETGTKQDYFTLVKGNGDTTVGIKKTDLVKSPGSFQLRQNVPNPFNPTTRLLYSVPQADFVTLKIYDTLGREIQTLVSEFQTAGTYSLEFDASKLSSGTYFYTLRIGDDFVETRKMLYLR